MKNIFIIGATSAIAEATAQRYATQGCHFFVVARNTERLSWLASDLKVRGAADVKTAVLDVNDFDRHQTIVDEAFQALGTIDLVLIAHGVLPDQKMCEHNVTALVQAFNTNAVSVFSLLTFIANRMEAQKQGTIAVISSVAGDRGRPSNYVYGAAKGAVSLFLQGLRSRLAKVGVHVLTIKPGFVDTPMTASYNKGLLWVGPEVIAAGIEKAVSRWQNVAYLPWWWQIIMMIIRSIPETLFKKLSL